MSTSLHPEAIERARDFILRNGRLIDRRRFEYAFDGGSADAVVSALAAYQNDDGGFGNALEPDIRASSSQSQCAEVAWHVLHETGRSDPHIIQPLLTWCADKANGSGGLPFALPNVVDGPRAPWWQPTAGPALNPTAAIVGLARALEVDHPWLDEAEASCWELLVDSEHLLEAHDVGCVLRLIGSTDAGADGQQQADVLERIRQRVIADLVVLDVGAGGYVFKPLSFAPAADSLSRPWFDDALIERHLDELQATQQEDGGWLIAWEPPEGAARAAWRSHTTVNALRTLRSYDR